MFADKDRQSLHRYEYEDLLLTETIIIHARLRHLPLDYINLRNLRSGVPV